MTYFKHSQFFTEDKSNAFDQINTPGTATPYSGIYRCEICGHEAVSTKGHPLPPEHHPCYQRTRWRLVAASHPA